MTSLSLGEHWEAFIRARAESGRHGSASEVVRDALRTLESRDKHLAALLAHLAKGEEQVERGELVEGFSLKKVVAKVEGWG